MSTFSPEPALLPGVSRVISCLAKFNKSKTEVGFDAVFLLDVKS